VQAEIQLLQLLRAVQTTMFCFVPKSAICEVMVHKQRNAAL
jgi:hypothetical protein